jgi:hypothetical protein
MKRHKTFFGGATFSLKFILPVSGNVCYVSFNKTDCKESNGIERSIVFLGKSTYKRQDETSKNPTTDKMMINSNKPHPKVRFLVSG